MQKTAGRMKRDEDFDAAALMALQADRLAHAYAARATAGLSPAALAAFDRDQTTDAVNDLTNARIDLAQCTCEGATNVIR